MSSDGADRIEPQPDQAWKALGLVNEWVRHAETKVAATLAATGVTAGVLFAFWRDWQDASWVPVAIGYVASLAVLSTGWACAMGLLPRRTAKPQDDGFIDHLHVGLTWIVQKMRMRPAPSPGSDDAPEDLVSLLFYSSIVHAYGEKGPEYREVLAALTSDAKGMTEHVGQQVWANASVAERKFTWANRAIVRLGISWLLIAVLAYMRVVGL